jgi:YidC/Oxa1 family membrane protein insertase
MRGILLPFIIRGLVATSKMQAVKPEIAPIEQRLQKAKKIGDKVAIQQETQNMVKKLAEHKVNPLAGLWGLVQIPFFISFFIATNKMGQAQLPGFTTGGFGWISNLSVPDPLYIAPLAVPVMAWGTIALQERVSPGLMSPFMKNVLFAGAILGLYFTISLPASVYYYLIPSIFLSGLQTILVNSPRFRKAAGLPPVVEVTPPTHDKADTKSVAAVRPMKLSEAFKEAREAINVGKN